jgi:hypothetical protein
VREQLEAYSNVFGDENLALRMESAAFWDETAANQNT